jgi:transcriptional regulator with XRE-family HTH domain
MAYGRYDSGLVDAEPARAHVRALIEAGMGRILIARAAGVPSTTLQNLVCGVPGRPGPTKRIRRETAEKILAVRFGDVIHAQRLDPTGTTRRLRALVALGYTEPKLAAEVGCAGETVKKLIIGNRLVSEKIRRRVAEAYDRLWDQAPVAADRWEKGRIKVARQRAEREGWAPPLAWDDDTIDDPAAKPYRPDEDTARVPGRPGKVTPEFLEDLEWLRTTGVSPKDAAERLGIRHDSLLVALRRHGEKELLEWAAGSQRMPISSNAA